jgi:uncharacterized damage-inducible protein DinB
MVIILSGWPWHEPLAGKPWARTSTATRLVKLRQLLLHAANHLQHHMRFVA